MTFTEVCAWAIKASKDRKEICYIYHSDNSSGYIASFQYWKDWLFRAYPGGRKELSMRGKKLAEQEQAL